MALNEPIKYILYNSDKKERIGEYTSREIERMTLLNRNEVDHLTMKCTKISGSIKFSSRLNHNVTCRRNDKNRRRIT